MTHLLPFLAVLASFAPPAVDADGQALPHGAVARLGTTRFRPGAPIETLAWSADGRTLLTVSGDENHSRAHLWDAGTGLPRDSFPVGPAAALAADGQRVLHVLAGKHAVTVRDVRTGRPVCEVEGNFPAAFTPDGRTFVYFRHPHLVLAEADTGKEIQAFGRIDSTQDAVWALAFAPLGRTVAALHDDETVRLWDLSSGKELRQFPAAGVTTLAIAPDGKTLALGGGTLQLLQMADGKARWEETERDALVRQLAFAPDGRTLAAGLEDGTVRLLDTATGKESRRLAGHGAPVRGVAFSPDGSTLAAGGDDGVVRRWDPTTGRPLQPADGWAGRAVALTASPDGRSLASVDRTGRLTLWDIGGTRLRAVAEGTVPSVLAYGPDGVLVTADGSGLALRDRDTGRVRQNMPTEKPVLAWSPRGSVLTGGFGDQSVVVLATGVEVCDLPPSTSVKVLFTADGRTLVRAGPTGLERFDAASGKKVDGWEPGEDEAPVCAFESLALSPDGRFVACADRNGGVHLWWPALGWRRLSLEGGDGFGDPAISPDGRLVAAGGRDGGVHVWEVASGRRLAKFTGHRGAFPVVAFLPDGRRLASAGGEGSVVLWDWAVPQANAVDLFHRADREPLWIALSDGGPAGLDAWRSLLAAGEDGVPWLAGKLTPATGLSAEQLARLLAQLDDERFDVRQSATATLRVHARKIEPALRTFLRSKPSLEAARRVEEILATVDQNRSGPWLDPEERRATRAVLALERSASPEARRLLAGLARGAENAVLTHEARAALARLDEKPSRENP